VPVESQASIDAFADGLWLEAGLARLTLEAYRRDLSMYARWLSGTQGGLALDATAENHLSSYFSLLHSQTKASTANRRLTVFKRTRRWAQAREAGEGVWGEGMLMQPL
jgi:integrase/recombinase XerD